MNVTQEKFTYILTGGIKKLYLYKAKEITKCLFSLFLCEVECECPVGFCLSLLF